jgi:hypothetical protein
MLVYLSARVGELLRLVRTFWSSGNHSSDLRGAWRLDRAGHQKMDEGPKS